MSVYSLTKGSEHALKLLALTGGNDTLLLIQPAREIRAEIYVQPAAEQKIEAELRLREQCHSMTLQTGDSANAQHLADWVEAIANGTLDTALAVPQQAEPAQAQTEQQPAIATILPQDPYDERDGIWISDVDLRRLAALPAGTKLYTVSRAQTGFVDALKRHRIALTPEYEGRWHADLYGSFEKPVYSAEGDTPEDAVNAVVRAALASAPAA